MGDFFEKLLKLKLVAKIAITLAMMGVIGGGYYGVFYSELEQQIRSANQHRDQLKGEKTSYEKRKVEYLAYRNELNQLQEEQRELLKALPKKAEIPNFLESIQQQAQTAGLEILSFQPVPEQPQELYVRIPVNMVVRGTYHQVNRFFKNLSELRRIVNSENVVLNPERTGNENLPTKMKATFTAATFRFQESGGG